MSQFLSQQAYRKLAVTVIKRHAGVHCLRMLRDEDMFGNVVSKLMIADWKFERGRGRSRYSYRIEQGKWGVSENIRFIKRGSRIPCTQINDDIVDRYFEREREQSERLERIEYCQELLRNTVMTRPQRDTLNMYYFQGMKIPAIAKRMELTNQAVQQCLARAEKAIQEIVS